MAPLAPALRAEPLGDAIKRPPVRIRFPNAKRPDRVRVHIANRHVRLRCEEEEQRSDAMFAASVIYCAANGASAVCSDEVTGFEPAACRLRPVSRRRYGPTRSCPSGRTARGCHQEAAGSNKTPKCKKARPHKRSGLFGPSDWIRTSGLLNPIQARYQTSPHPVKEISFDMLAHSPRKCKTFVK